MEESIRKRALRAIGEGVFPGCVIAVVKRSGERLLFPFGGFTGDRRSPRMRVDSAFDVASITKSLPTASLALTLVEEGVLEPEETIARYLPEASRCLGGVTVRHLLTHTVQFGFRLSAHKQSPPDRLLHLLLTSEPSVPPGTAFSYSNGASILLGLVVERVSGRRLDRFADERFFTPLRMESTGFHPLMRMQRERIVPTEIDPWRGRVVQGEVHDESAYTLSRVMVPGSAGLFSTAPDLLNFLDMLLAGGVWGGRRFFSERMIRRMSTNQAGPIGACTGLGWELFQRSFMGARCSGRTIGKTGFTGCSCVCDLERGVGIVILSGYTYPRRKSTRGPIDEVRRDIADIVLGELGTG